MNLKFDYILDLRVINLIKSKKMDNLIKFASSEYDQISVIKDKHDENGLSRLTPLQQPQDQTSRARQGRSREPSQGSKSALYMHTVYIH
jgi:hypothetical protein